MDEYNRVVLRLNPPCRALEEGLHLADHPIKNLAHRLAPRPPECRAPVPSLADIGFAPSNLATLKIPTGMSGGASL